MPQINRGRKYYAEMYNNDISGLLEFAGTPEVVTGLLLQKKINIDVDATAAEFTILSEGTYKCHMTASLSADKTCTLHGEFLLNGVPILNAFFERGVSASGAVGDVATKGSVDVVSGDIITFAFDSTQANTTVTLNHYNIDITGI